VKASGNLLVGFSGGLGSTVLLDLLSKVYFLQAQPTASDAKQKGGKDNPRNARVWNKASVCYVEVCNAFPGVCPP
jgi:cytoplasmic tRNA 2-thiolation protein 2